MTVDLPFKEIEILKFKEDILRKVFRFYFFICFIIRKMQSQRSTKYNRLDEKAERDSQKLKERRIAREEE